MGDVIVEILPYGLAAGWLHLETCGDRVRVGRIVRRRAGAVRAHGRRAMPRIAGGRGRVTSDAGGDLRTRVGRVTGTNQTLGY